MHELAPLIQDLAIMLGVASIITLIFQRIHQPVVLGYLVAGIIIGPHTPPYSLVTDVREIQTLSELGVIFLMFSLGLDFSFHKLTRLGFSASVTGIIEVLIMLAIGFTIGILLGWSYHASLFLAAAIAISSTTIIIKALEELNLKRKRFAEFIFGLLVVEDLLAILLLVALSTVIATQNIFSYDMLLAVLQLFFVVGGWFLVGYFIVPIVMKKIARFASEETITIVSIALCLFLVVIATYFHYSAALGAFIMGSILAETPLVHRIEHLIRPIRDIFAAVFFISVGMLIDPKLIIHHFPLIIMLTCVVIFGKMIATSVGSFLTGQSFNTSIRVGLGMGQIGEFSFIIAALGLALNATNELLYPVIVAVSVLTTFTAPYRIKLSGYITKFLDEHLPKSTKLFLDGYSSWVYRALATSETQSIYQQGIFRVILNGIVIAIVFSITQHIILPELAKIFHKTWITRLESWVIAMILSSPFIWGMIFAVRVPRPVGGKSGLAFFTTPVIVCWLVAVLEITILSITYFHNWFTTSLLILMSILFFVLSYRQLERSYHWFEDRLVGNIKQPSGKEVRYEELAPWDSHLVEIDVGSDSILVGKTLTQMQLRQDYGINIVAIYRGTTSVLAPRGDQVILANDRLVVLGTDDRIDDFTKIAVRKTFEEPKQEEEILGNYSLRAVVLESDNPIIGKTIRDSKIRETIGGLVVGLERDGVQILNPDPATVLLQGDLIKLVGETSRLDQI